MKFKALAEPFAGCLGKHIPYPVFRMSDKIRSMPVVFRSGPYRFYFYSHEPNEPPHIHVDRDNLSAKFG